MKVSAVKTILTAKDILTIINDYVHVEGLKINSLQIDELITVFGSYKKGVEIPFKAEIGLGNIFDNCINAKLFNISVAKVGILGGIRNLALKKILKEFSDLGITVDKDIITIDLNLLSKAIPYFYFKAKDITLKDGAVEVELEEIIYSQDKDVVQFSKKENLEDRKIKLSDKYTNLRRDVINKIPERYKGIAEYAMMVPDIIALLWRLLKDKRVNLKTKAIIGGTIAYLASPIDIIPDFIPFIGSIDDVAVSFFVLSKIMKEIPKEILLENWEGRVDIFDLVEKGIGFISNLVGSSNVQKLLNLVKKITVKNEKKVEKDEECNNIH